MLENFNYIAIAACVLIAFFILARILQLIGDILSQLQSMAFRMICVEADLNIEKRSHEVDLEVKLLNNLAKLPFKKRHTDAGYDIFSIEDKVIPCGTSEHSETIRTGIAISAPPGYYYTIEGRSSLYIQNIFPKRAIIDATYCGELIVSLINLGPEPYKIKTGDRIAQIVLGKQLHANFNTVEEFSDVYNQRGTNGFGSTGR